MSHKLLKPIQAHGEEVTEITLREPTGQEILDIGFPYLIVIGEDENSQAMQIQAKTVGKYISKLAGIPPGSVGQLGGPDLSALMGEVLSFFGVAAGT
jgi:hypothetical protein